MRWVGTLRMALTLVCLAQSICMAGETGGGQPGAFLRVGVGSRALGMGGAFVAVADDATASYWNPAGLSLVRELQLSGTYTEISLGRQYNFAGIAVPLGAWGTMGANWINFGVKNIDGRDQTGLPTGMFSNNEQALLLTYGVRLFPGLAVGGGIKLLRHTLAANSAYGYGYDAGVLLMPAPFFILGANIQNLQTHLAWNTPRRTREIFPQVARVGVQIKPAPFLRLSADYEMSSQANGKWLASDLEEGEWRSGGELWMGKILALRAGMNRDSPAYGASLAVPSGNSAFQIDYSFASDPIDAFPTHRLAVLLKFGKPLLKEAARQETPREHTRPGSQPSSRTSGTGWLRARVIEAQSPYLTIYVNRSDLLQPGMMIRLNQFLSATRVGKFYGTAEVILIREKRVMIQLSKARAFPVGELLALKIPSAAAEE